MITPVLEAYSTGGGLAMSMFTGSGAVLDGVTALVIREPEDRRIRKVIQMIDRDPAMRLPQLSASVNLSVSRLRHLFRAQTGQGIGAYLIASRLLHAAALLRGTELRVKEVAARVGYDGSAGFVRAFHLAFQQPPARYRNTSAFANE